MLEKGKLLIAYAPKNHGYGDTTRFFSFRDKLLIEMNRRSPTGGWETPDDSDSEFIGCGSKYLTANPDLLSDDFEVSSVDGLSVYEMGRTGLMLTKAEERYNSDFIKLLPACREGFYRDWEHDGICVSFEDKNIDKCRRKGGNWEWFKRYEKCFDLTFKIHDLEATRSKHQDRVERLEKRMEDEGITYDDIAGGYFADNIECEIVGSTAWHLRSQWKDWDDRTQAVVKQIKSWINGVTKNYISERLKDNGIPASYDTAFYLKYYPQVNAVMKDVAERII